MRVAAVDLGASSGRVMAGTVGPGRLELDEVHRFPNGPVRVARAERIDAVLGHPRHLPRDARGAAGRG